MKKNINRYTDMPFPPYRYVPVVTPHPVINPAGHSYGRPEPQYNYLSPIKWQENSPYLYGVDLYNYGYWWEAHEVWEGLWLLTKKLDVEGQFLQSLIQFSAAMLKLYSGNANGFFKLIGEAKKRMGFCLLNFDEKKQSHYMGLFVTDWMQRVNYFQDEIRQSNLQKIDPIESPLFPAMILNWEQK